MTPKMNKTAKSANINIDKCNSSSNEKDPKKQTNDPRKITLTYSNALNNGTEIKDLEEELKESINICGTRVACILKELLSSKKTKKKFQDYIPF